jgi:RNA methyltransferase, TrmH family
MARRFPVSGRESATRGPIEKPSVGSPGGLGEAPSDTIRSRDNKWLKMFRAALRGTGPAAGESIGVEGPKLVEEAVRSGLEAEALLVSEAGEAELERILVAASESDAGIPRARILRTTDKLFESVAGTEAPQGVAALFRTREWSFDDLLRGSAGRDGSFRGDIALVVVMAGVQDPGNVGTIVRSAEAFAATGIVATRGTADPWSPKALRASAGSALRLPVMRGVALPVLLAQLRATGLQVMAAISRARGDDKLKFPDLRGKLALFIGSEGTGLPAEVVRTADATLAIPMSAEVESLNAGVAASVLLYEISNQRKRGQG